MNDSTWRWMKRGEILDDIFYDKIKYHQNSVMVFNVIRIGFKSKLIFMDQNVDEIEYRRLFEEFEICKLDEILEGLIHFCFMQDGAPARNYKTTRFILMKDAHSLKDGLPIALKSILWRVVCGL